MPNEKADFSSLKKIFRYVKKYVPALILAFLFAIGGSVTTIIGPNQISGLTNIIVAGMFSSVDMEQFFSTAAKLAIIYLSGAFLHYAQQFITATVTQNTARALRTDIDRKINRLPLRFFDSSKKGDILSRITNDVDTISQTLSTSAASLLSSAVLFFGVIFQMFRTNVLLSLVTMFTSVLGFVGMRVILKHSQKYFVRKQKDLGIMNGQIEEVYTNHNVVSVFGAKDRERAIFEEVNERLFDSNWKSQMLSGMMMPIMMLTGNLAYVLIFVVGVAFILAGNPSVSMGTIMAFVIYARLFSQPLSSFAQAMTSMQQASAAAKRVFDILEREELSDESEKKLSIPEVRGHVEFRHVRFGYSPDKTIIHDFSADLQPGQKVAIVGPTGAGKTTLVNLLMRFYEVDSGDILIDGVSIRDLKREQVHDLFDMILQDTWLFTGTLRENLVYNRKDVPEEEILQAVRAVCLGHFIRTLPEGLDTRLSDALNLSEGQKQQLTIARAILKGSPLLILDEATSSVDTRTELVIQEAMDRLTQNRTSFVIAHRLSTIKNADVILVLKDGDIVEQGNHETLLQRNGFYAELYNSQFAQV